MVSLRSLQLSSSDKQGSRQAYASLSLTRCFTELNCYKQMQGNLSFSYKFRNKQVPPNFLLDTPLINMVYLHRGRGACSYCSSEMAEIQNFFVRDIQIIIKNVSKRFIYKPLELDHRTPSMLCSLLSNFSSRIDMQGRTGSRYSRDCLKISPNCISINF